MRHNQLLMMRHFNICKDARKSVGDYPDSFCFREAIHQNRRFWLSKKGIKLIEHDTHIELICEDWYITPDPNSKYYMHQMERERKIKLLNDEYLNNYGK